MTKDYLGKELHVGDTVILVRPNYRDLCLAKITNISSTGKTVYLEYRDYSNYMCEVKQNSKQVIKYFKPESE